MLMRGILLNSPAAVEAVLANELALGVGAAVAVGVALASVSLGFATGVAGFIVVFAARIIPLAPVAALRALLAAAAAWNPFPINI